MWSRLMAIAVISEAQLKLDPLPHLDRAAGRIFELERAVEDARMMLSGADDFDLHQESCPDVYVGIVELALVRNKKAYDRLLGVSNT